MTESTNNTSLDNTSLDEENGFPVPATQCTNALRPTSSLSGGSDNDGTERPIREKLKKASIAGLSTHGKENNEKAKFERISAESSAGEEQKGGEDAMLTDTTSPLRGRPTRKRSFDDLQNESLNSIDSPPHDIATGGHHKRMRSRDMSSNKKVEVNGKTEREQVEALAEEEDDADAKSSPGGAGVMVEAPSMGEEAAPSGNQSPKKKRSRDQFDKDDSVEGSSPERNENQAVLSTREPHQPAEELNSTGTNGDKGEPEKKRHRDSSEENTKSVDSEDVTKKVWKCSVSNISHADQ
jgi:Ran-binding protein 3